MKLPAIKRWTAAEHPGFQAVVHRELVRIFSRRIYLLMVLILPPVSFAVLAAIFSTGSPRHLPIAVYDADNTDFSRRLVRLLDAAPSLHVAQRVTDLKEGKALILSGGSYALVVLPRGLERDRFRGQGAQVTSFYNNQSMTAGSIVNRGIRDTLKTVSAELDLQSRQQRGEMSAAAAVHAEPIIVESRALFNPYLNYLYFLAGALMPTMLQIFIIVVTVYAVGVEMKEGSSRDWLDTAGGSSWAAVAGKLAPYTAGFLCVGLLMNSYLFLWLKLPLRGSVTLIALATVLLVLSYQAVALLIVAATGNLRISLSTAAIYSAPAFAFAGITFPVMAMPLSGKIWGGLLPLSYYLIILLDQGMRGAPVSVSLPALAAMCGFVIFIPILAVPRLGRLMVDEQQWGKR
jgi:ABC-2 type transport system permease protein